MYKRQVLVGVVQEHAQLTDGDAASHGVQRTHQAHTGVHDVIHKAGGGVGQAGNCLLYTSEKAQALGLKFGEENFPGHPAIVCTHPDGHNHSGNIHVHIVIGSIRMLSLIHIFANTALTPAQQLKLSFSCGRMLETTLQNYLPCYVTGADARRLCQGCIRYANGTVLAGKHAETC